VRFPLIDLWLIFLVIIMLVLVVRDLIYCCRAWVLLRPEFVLCRDLDYNVCNATQDKDVGTRVERLFLPLPTTSPLSPLSSFL
jgi:hypothetical protein